MILWAKLGGILAAVLACLAIGYHFGRASVQLMDAKSEIKQQTAQIVDQTAQLKTDTQAEAAHDQAIEHPPALVISKPVWLHDTQACPGLPVPTAAAGDNPAPRPADAGSLIDLRPQLAAFAQKYEAALADCRRVIAEWPR